MATVSAQIRIDADVKAQSMALFQNLGLDLSTAVNVFLRQCLIHRGLKKGLEDLAAGRVRPAEEVFAEMMEGHHAVSG